MTLVPPLRRPTHALDVLSVDFGIIRVEEIIRVVDALMLKLCSLQFLSLVRSPAVGNDNRTGGDMLDDLVEQRTSGAIRNLKIDLSISKTRQSQLQ